VEQIGDAWLDEATATLASPHANSVAGTVLCANSPNENPKRLRSPFSMKSEYLCIELSNSTLQLTSILE
jgi:hypothetical protein